LPAIEYAWHGGEPIRPQTGANASGSSVAMSASTRSWPAARAVAQAQRSVSMPSAV